MSILGLGWDNRYEVIHSINRWIFIPALPTYIYRMYITFGIAYKVDMGIGSVAGNLDVYEYLYINIHVWFIYVCILKNIYHMYITFGIACKVDMGISSVAGIYMYIYMCVCVCVWRNIYICV
jgi:hypothetical protein